MINEVTKLENMVHEKTLDLTNEDFDFMLAHIGDPDPKLRDETIYILFCRLFLENGGCLTREKAKLIVNKTLKHDRLFEGIEASEPNDLVFTRTFTALLYCIFLDVDTKENYQGFLSALQRKQLLDDAVLYLQKERDYRGFVIDKGWAHAPAHGGDFLDQAANHPQFGKTRVHDALKSLQTIILSVKTVFVADEESRFDNCIVTMLENEWLTGNKLVEWADKIDQENAKLNFRDSLFLPRMHTWHAFLKSAYFKIKAKKLDDQVFANYIEHTLEQYYLRNGFI